MAEQRDNRSGISFGWEAGDSSWGTDVNKNFEILAYAGFHLSIKGQATNTPPTNPTEGDSYTVGSAATGAWSTFSEHSIAVWGHSAAGGDVAWLNITPKLGYVAYEETTPSLIGFNGTTWATIGTSTGGTGGMTIEQIVMGLSQLTGASRLSYTALKDLPTAVEFLTSAQRDKITSSLNEVFHDTTLTGKGQRTDVLTVAIPFTQDEKTKLAGLENETGPTIVTKLTGLVGQAKLPYSALRDPPQGTGSADTGQQIVTKLEGLTGNEKLQYGALRGGPPVDAEQNVQADWGETDTSADSYIERKPTIPTAETGATIKTKLEGLQDQARLDASAIKNLPGAGSGADTGPQIVSKLEGLSGNAQLQYSAIRGGPSTEALTEVATSDPVQGDGKADATAVTLNSATKAKLAKLFVDQPTFEVANYQSDWDESNVNSFNYIRNKPATLGGGGITTILVDSNTMNGDGITTNLAVRFPYTQAEKTKLAGIESGATADQSNTEIRDALTSLSGTARLPYSAIKDTPNIPPNQGEPNVQADWNETDTAQDDYIKNKPTIPSDLADRLSKLNGIETGATADQTATEIRDKLQSLQDQARLDATAIKNLPSGGTGGVTKDTVIECISEQAGERVDDLIEAVTNLSMVVGTVAGDTINFNDNTDIVKSVNNVDPFMAGMYSLLTVVGYDPIVLDNDFLLAKPAITPPISLANVPTQFGDSQSQEFLLLRDGAPISVSGSDPKVYHTIRVGRSSNNAPLVAKITPTTALSLTIRVARLSALGVSNLADTTISSPANNHILIRSGTSWINTAISALGAQFKAALEALTGANRLDSTAIKDLNQVPDTGTTGWVLTKTATGYAFQAPTAMAQPLVTDGTISGANTQANPYRVTYPLTSASSAKLNALETNRQLPDLSTGSVGQVPKIQTGGTTVAWEDDIQGQAGTALPTGGRTGQQLTKNSDRDGDAGWGDAISESDQGKIDFVYDLFRDVDDEISLTPANLMSGELSLRGYSNMRINDGLERFGSVSGDDPPTFSVGDESFRVLRVVYNPTLAFIQLLVYIGGANNATTSVPELPAELEFKVGNVTFRARANESDFQDRTGASAPYQDAYRLYTTQDRISASLFTAGTAITFQVLLNATADDRLLPADASDADIGKFAKLGTNKKPEWADIPSGLGGFAEDLLDSVRGVTIAQANQAVRQFLTGFSTPLTLAATDHGVMLVSVTASVAPGSTSQFSLTAVQQLDVTDQVHLSVLRGTAYYDNSAGRSGNGDEVASFVVFNTASPAVAQGTIRCYIARNQANQVGTYARYIPASGASSSLAGSIALRWEVTLLRTDSSAGGGMGSSFTQAQIEEFARDAVGTALTEGDNASTADITFVANDSANTYEAQIKSGVITPGEIAKDSTDVTKAAELNTWKTLFDIPASSGGGGGGALAITEQTDATTASVATSATHNLRTVTLNAPQLLYRKLMDYDLFEQVVVTMAASAANTNVKLQAVKGATGTEVIYESGRFTVATTATPYTLVLDLGSDDTSYRLQVVNLSSTNTVNITNNSNITYPRLKGVTGSEISVPPIINTGNFHHYDSVESFAKPAGFGTIAALAFNAPKNILSVIDTSGNHIAVHPDTGSQFATSWNTTIPNASSTCHAAWDSTGRYLYYVTQSSPVLRVIDFGAGATPSPSRDTSKEFTVTTLITGLTNIRGIHLSASNIRFLVQSSSGHFIHTTNLTGAKVTEQSDIPLPSALTSPRGLNVVGNFESVFIAQSAQWIGKLDVTGTGHTRTLEMKIRESFPLKPNSTSGMTYKPVGNQLYQGLSSTTNGQDIQVYDKVIDPTATKTWQLFSLLTAPSSVRISTTTYAYQSVGSFIKNPSNDEIIIVIIRVSRSTGVFYRSNSSAESIYNIGTFFGNRVSGTTTSLSGVTSQGFIKGNNIYLASTSSQDSFKIFPLATFTDSGTTQELAVPSEDGTAYINQVYADATNIWILRGTKARCYKLSDFTRDPTKDITPPSSEIGDGWAVANDDGSIVYNNFTGNSTHILFGRHNSPSTNRMSFVAYLKSTGARDASADFVVQLNYSSFLFEGDYALESGGHREEGRVLSNPRGFIYTT